jgi:hypothetical protein
VERYFFHIHNSLGFIEDEEGRDLPGIEQARNEAVKGIRSIIGAEVESGVIDLRGRIDICDEAGGVLMTLPFEETVEIIAGEVPAGADEEKS